jgi:hypothetical protein
VDDELGAAELVEGFDRRTEEITKSISPRCDRKFAVKNFSLSVSDASWRRALPIRRGANATDLVSDATTSEYAGEESWPCEV